MNLKNDKEVFNFVATHLFTQGKRATGFDQGGYEEALRLAEKNHYVNAPEKEDFLRCRYRAEDGCKCAVGALIPDDLYDPNMENRGAWSVCSKNFRGMAEHFEGANIQLLAGLQLVHDNSDNWMSTEDMKDKLRHIAREYHVSDYVLTNLKFEDR